jgi:hypothetical protein
MEKNEYLLASADLPSRCKREIGNSTKLIRLLSKQENTNIGKATTAISNIWFSITKSRQRQVESLSHLNPPKPNIKANQTQRKIPVTPNASLTPSLLI